ncbi:MAG: GGDEF domain-containing protein [Planctomycetes bacterium]|jgi:diguanylate cyclase (GGDEF)-like protein|nr:GGDEF domain-containing protein [Planctomycetota bacterium]
MSDGVNAIFGFLQDQWHLALAIAAALVVVLYVASRLVSARRDPVVDRRFVRSGARSGPVPTPVADRDEAPDERQRFKAIVTDLRIDNAKLLDQIRKLKNRTALIGPLMKELNSNVDRGMMAPLVERVLDRVFGPARILMYLNEGDPEVNEELTLVVARGVTGLSHGDRLDPATGGGGFLGLVGRKRVAMSRADLRFESNLMRRKVAESEVAGADIEMAVPVVYRSHLLGILGIAGLREEAEDALALFGMIGDLTALAFANYLQFHKIEQLANSDPLTLLFNKGYFLDICDQAVRTALERSQPLSILMFDVDNFKNYNDTNGHLAGDRLLRRLAELMKGIVRDRGVLARFGGEEFIAVFRGTPEEARETAEEIRMATAGHPFEHRERQPLGFLSVSGGVASLPVHGTTVEDLIGAADAALYRGKWSGRNRIEVAGDITADFPVMARASRDAITRVID